MERWIGYIEMGWARKSKGKTWVNGEKNKSRG